MGMTSLAWLDEIRAITREPTSAVTLPRSTLDQLLRLIPEPSPVVVNVGSHHRCAACARDEIIGKLLVALQAAAASSGFQYMIAETRERIDAAIALAETVVGSADR